VSPITITAEQRDALYEQLMIRLSGIDAVWRAFNEGDLAKTERLGREFSDNLRLVLDDLGLGKGTGESVELTTPPDVLRRVFDRVRKVAEAQRTSEEEERAETQRSGRQNRLVLETCESLLLALPAEQRPQ
jgi:hypothetical protein